MSTSERVELYPVEHPWDSPRVRRMYLGSSLVAQGGQLRYTPPSGDRSMRPWALTTGREPGTVSAFVRVRGSVAVGAKGLDCMRVDRVAAVDPEGAVLASFVCGEEGTAVVGSTADWFTDGALADFAARAGLELRQAQVATPDEIEQRFPGLYPQGLLRTARGIGWAMGVAYLLGGLLLLGVALARSGDSPAFAVALGLVGVGMAVLGAFLFPPVLARLRSWRSSADG